MNVKSSDIYLNSLCLTAYAPGEKSTELARAVVKMYDDISLEERTLMKPINVLYVNLLRDVSKGTLNLSNRAEVAEVLTKYSQEPAFKDCSYQFDELKNLLTPAEPVSDGRIRTLFNRVRRWITWMRGDRRMRKMLIDLRKAGNEGDDERQQALLEKLLKDAETLRSDFSTEDLAQDDNQVIEEIAFNDPKSISRALAAQDKKDNGARIRFGWQGFNRMFGPKRSAKYGEMFGVGARSHNYKSGLLMDIARWICTLNKPPETSGLTPIVLFISLENEVNENLRDWYKKLYVNQFRKYPGDLSNEELVEYVITRFNANGFRMIAKRRMGDTFSYHDYEAMVEEEEKKYNGKVVATVLDYLTLCHRLPEDREHNDAVQLQMLANRFHNHSNHSGIFFATGFQLETAASQLAASGKHNIVKQYNESHLSDCKGIKRELDQLFFLELEKNHHGVTYLTMAWNKNRYEHHTAAEDKYFAYRFTNFGILDDVDGEDKSVKDIYADDESDDVEGVATTHVVDIF